MKKLIISFTLIFTLIFECLGQSPENNTATINSDFVISLPQSEHPKDVYIIDISNLAFKDQQTCEMFWKKMSEYIAAYSLDYSTQKVTLTLSYNGYNVGWNIEKWNNYFMNRSQKMLVMYSKLNT